jgi:hypothetical protein
MIILKTLNKRVYEELCQQSRK